MHNQTVVSPGVSQLVRNFILLTIIRTYFEADLRRFRLSKHYSWRSPYAAVVERVIQRINGDIARVKQSLQQAGYQPETVKNDMQYGTYAGELELLMDYYLGNLRYTPDDQERSDIR
jgi:hypothetical protein